MPKSATTDLSAPIWGLIYMPSSLFVGITVHLQLHMIAPITATPRTSDHNSAS